jgi:hypothetical protein
MRFLFCGGTPAPVVGGNYTGGSYQPTRKTDSQGNSSESIENDSLYHWEAEGRNRTNDSTRVNLNEFYAKPFERQDFVRAWLSNPNRGGIQGLLLWAMNDEHKGENNQNLKALIDTVAAMAKAPTQNGTPNQIAQELYAVFNQPVTDSDPHGDQNRQIMEFFINNCKITDLESIIKNALLDSAGSPNRNPAQGFLTSLSSLTANNDINGSCVDKINSCIERIYGDNFTSSVVRTAIEKEFSALGTKLKEMRELGVNGFNFADGSGTINRADLQLLTGKQRERLCIVLLNQLPNPNAARKLKELTELGLLKGLDAGSWDNIGAAIINKAKNEVAKMDPKPDLAAINKKMLELFQPLLDGVKTGLDVSPSVYPKDDVSIGNTKTSSVVLMLYDSVFNNNFGNGLGGTGRSFAQENLAYKGQSNREGDSVLNHSIFNNIKGYRDGGGNSRILKKATDEAKGIVNRAEIKTADVRTARTAIQREGNASVSTAEANKNREACETAARNQVASARSVAPKTPPESGNMVTYSFPARTIPMPDLPDNIKDWTSGTTTITIGQGQTISLNNSGRAINLNTPFGAIVVNDKGEISGNISQYVTWQENAYVLKEGIEENINLNGIAFSVYDGNLHVSSEDKEINYQFCKDGTIKVLDKIGTPTYEIKNGSITMPDDFILNNDRSITTKDGLTVKVNNEVDISFDLPSGINAEQFQEMAISYLSATRDGAAIGSPTAEDLRKLMSFMKELAGVFNNWNTAPNNTAEKRKDALIEAFKTLGLPPPGNDPAQQRWLDIMFPDPLPESETPPGHLLYNFLNADAEGPAKMFKAMQNLAFGKEGTQELIRNGKSLLMCHNIHVSFGTQRNQAVSAASHIGYNSIQDAVFRNYFYNHIGPGNEGAQLMGLFVFLYGQNPKPAAFEGWDVSLSDSKIEFKYNNETFTMDLTKDIIDKLLENLKESRNLDNIEDDNREEFFLQEAFKELSLEARHSVLTTLNNYVNTHSMRFLFGVVDPPAGA